MIPFLSKFRKNKFEKNVLTENKSELNNPSRGWYKMFYFVVGEEPDWEKVKRDSDESNVTKNGNHTVLVPPLSLYTEKQRDQVTKCDKNKIHASKAKKRNTHVFGANGTFIFEGRAE